MAENPYRQHSFQERVKFSIASLAAQFFVQFLHPLDVIKTRMQSHDGCRISNIVPKYSSLKHAVEKIYKQEGLRGFTKGIMLSYFANSIAGSIFFYIFENTKYDLYLVYGHNSKKAVFLASIYSSILSTLLTQPLWVTLTRLQLNIQPNITGYTNLRETMTLLYKQHGVRGFYRGTSLSLLLSVHGMIQITSYEYLMMLLCFFEIEHYYLLPFMNGIISKGLAVYLTYPMVTIRTRIQQNQFHLSKEQPKYSSILDVIKKTWENEKMFGFYKGVIPSLMKGLPQKGIYFLFYEQFKKALNIGRID